MFWLCLPNDYLSEASLQSYNCMCPQCLIFLYKISRLTKNHWIQFKLINNYWQLYCRYLQVFMAISLNINLSGTTMGFKRTLLRGKIPLETTWSVTSLGYHATLITKRKFTSYGPFDINSINFDTLPVSYLLYLYSFRYAAMWYLNWGSDGLSTSAKIQLHNHCIGPQT